MMIFPNGLKNGLETKLYFKKYIKRDILQKSNRRENFFMVLYGFACYFAISAYNREDIMGNYSNVSNIALIDVQ
jgi:hypothetical protein